MTLVMSYICDRFALQVSDRRLSRGGSPLPDEYNKAVVWCAHALVGYTGFAFVDRRQRSPQDQVDEWIVETLFRRKNIREVMQALEQEAPTWVNAMPGPWRPQAFSLVGWAPQPDATVRPFAGLVSNFHGERGEIRATSTEEFSRRVVFPPPGQWFMSQVGEPLLPSELRAVKGGLRRLDAQGAGPDRVADLLMAVLALVSSRAAGRVGTTAMVSCLPPPEIEPVEAVLLTERRGRPTLHHPSFFYRGPDPDSVTAFGPHLVCGENAWSEPSVEYFNESGSDMRVSATLRGPKDKAEGRGTAQTNMPNA
ncbi:hypothetical protein [Georgenia faecalis]|uniref:Uncharacterized protein n=1 Tax=Georgenia faecalis TaxID=2483799 RepID=A0ABV9D9G8_9MICO|nr:hypothetical protein [Georgenia faecalis]